MFLLRSDFKKGIIILLITSVLLGTILVIIGGYLTDNYFANMVSDLIGDYGEYDLLFTLATDKEEIALEQIKKIVSETLPGSTFKTGPRVAGSSNYLLKLPDKYKNEMTYINLGKYFADIPGLMSKTIMTEPRLSVRGFRGNSRPIMRALIEKVNGIAFLYPTGDGLDIIVERADLVPGVKWEISAILEEYRLLEIRYPLNQHPDNLPLLQEGIYSLLADDLEEVIDVTSNNESDRVSLLTSLKQMKTFLLSYASKVVISDLEESERIAIGSRLMAREANGNSIGLEVIDNQNNSLVALIQEGTITGEETTLDIYLQSQSEEEADRLGTGEINNPRQDLADALDRLNEITPILNGFLEQSEQLVGYSEQLSTDLVSITQGLNQLEQTGQNLHIALQEWRQEGLSFFLGDLLVILDDIKTNVGDINDIQSDLIRTSNRLKEGAGLIEEKLIFVPRNNSLFRQLEQLKDLFLQLATLLDNNYDLVAMRLNNMNPVVSSIDEWKEKINSLLKVEDTLDSGADWQVVETIIGQIDEAIRTLDTSDLQDKLASIKHILIELKTTQLPVVLNQLSYIQNSLPDLKETEIVETINLIDSYIAGQVIPGDQIQLLLQGEYNSKEILTGIKKIINNPAVSYIDNMEAGYLAPNTRGEVFNILSQVRAVISTIIALVFTLLVMILDQTLIISFIRLNQGNGLIYGFFSGGLIFTSICYLSSINFPYLDFRIELIIGGVLGLLIALFASMLNPVNEKEWEAGQALGFSPAEIMREIIIPAGKPGLLYLLNYPGVIFK
jgi:hypothetical protein